MTSRNRALIASFSQRPTWKTVARRISLWYSGPRRWALPESMARRHAVAGRCRAVPGRSEQLVAEDAEQPAVDQPLAAVARRTPAAELGRRSAHGRCEHRLVDPPTRLHRLAPWPRHSERSVVVGVRPGGEAVELAGLCAGGADQYRRLVLSARRGAVPTIVTISRRHPLHRTGSVTVRRSATAPAAPTPPNAGTW